MFLWSTPMPPARAIAIAISDSVTVSIAADAKGTCNGIPREKRDPVATSLGCVIECRGTNNTSSNVRATSGRTRDASLRGSSLREGPLPVRSWTAGLVLVRVPVAMVECIVSAHRSPVGVMPFRARVDGGALAAGERMPRPSTPFADCGREAPWDLRSSARAARYVQHSA